MHREYDGVHLCSNGRYYQAWWIDPHGRRQRRSLGSKAKVSRKGAAAKCRKLEREIEASPAQMSGATAPTLGAWLDQYQELRAPDVAEGTAQLDRQTADRLRQYFGADVTIDRIQPIDGERWRAWLRDQGKPATVAGHCRRAKAIFEKARKLRLIPWNPMEDLPTTAPEPPKDWHYATDAELRRILDACPSRGWRCLFALARWAGLRRGEALRLRWEDVHWADNLLVIRLPDGRGESTKHRRRTPPIEIQARPTGLTAELREAWRQAQGELVCPGIDRGSIDRRAREIVHIAGIDYTAPIQTLRRNWRTDIEQIPEIPAYVADAWLGHSSSVARRHYLSIPPDLYRPPNAGVPSDHRPQPQAP